MLAAELRELFDDIFGNDGILEFGENSEEWPVAEICDMRKSGDLWKSVSCQLNDDSVAYLLNQRRVFLSDNIPEMQSHQTQVLVHIEAI